MTDLGEEPAGPATRSSVTKVAVATAVSALCGYAVIYLAARDLAPAGFSVFGVFWGAFGLVTGAAFGLLQETTREVRSAPQLPASAGTPGPHTPPMRVAAVAGAVAAILIAGSSPLWARQVFAESPRLSVTLLAVGLGGFCLHATLLGTLAGTNRWSEYGALMVTDAGFRVVVAVSSVAAGWGLTGFLWATVAGSAAWLLRLLGSAPTRTAAQIQTPIKPFDFLRGSAHSVTAAGASSILVMGFPVLLKVTSPELGATGGVIILAVTLTRAPLLVPLTAMQGNLIAYFVDQRRHRVRALVRPALLVASIGAAGIMAAGALGPWLLKAFFGTQYQAGSALLMWLTAGAVSIAMLTLTGAATVAAALHRAYSLGWVGATLTSGLLLLLPTTLEIRTVVALLCGPVAGIAVHLVAMARTGDVPG